MFAVSRDKNVCNAQPRSNQRGLFESIHDFCDKTSRVVHSLHLSFTNTETSKDLAQKVIAGELAGYRPKAFLGEAQILRNQLQR